MNLHMGLIQCRDLRGAEVGKTHGDARVKGCQDRTRKCSGFHQGTSIAGPNL